jgi:uncharacterized protein involved in outer membrane biogenesis
VKSWIIRRALMGTAAAIAAVVFMAAMFAAAVDAGYLRGPFIRFISAHTGRPIRIDGPLEAHILSLHPRLNADGVTIGNPSWMPPGVTAQIGKMSLLIDLPRPGHSIGIERLEMQAATLHLVRDSTGRANWQSSDPAKGDGGALPIIRSLSMQNAHVDLDDARRHLRFDGVVSAHDLSGTQGAPPLRIEGSGQLNGRAATFEITCDPLAGVSRQKPYNFTFVERSSGSRLAGGGFLLRPFYFDALDTTFDGTGADLKDLYYLTGVSLVNTGSYRLSGKISRRGTNTRFSDLSVAFGQSDMRGEVSIETSSGRPKLDADLHSKFLRMSDLGLRAAGRDPEPAAGLLLSNAMLSLAAVRRGDARAKYHALHVEVGHESLGMVAARMTIEHGILVVAPLTAEILGGKLTAHVRLDATSDVPPVDVDLRIADLQLGQFDRKGTGEPPVEGLLRARVNVTGRGTSIHQVAATANGTVTAVLPHGTVRDSLAELTGIDLRGLGLLMTKNARETGVRCGVASFEARDGTLTAQSLVMDTDPVLITGDGVVHLDSEALELEFRGHPKRVQLLRFRAPILMRGTLAHPSIEIQARHAVAQAAEAVALGVVLTPLAAVLAFVDPGLAKNADCAALLAATDAGGAGTRSLTSAH